MIGGAGNDSYVVDSPADRIVENAGEGTDTVTTSLYSYVLAANVENLTYSGTSAFNGGGNASDNTITGGASGDYLDGFSGKDTLKGGGGADHINGGAGNDWLFGNQGNDFLIGGTGSDRFTIAQGDGYDKISDFKKIEGDKLQFSGSTSFNQFKIYNDASGNAHVAFGNADVTLLGVNAASIDSSFFTFA